MESAVTKWMVEGQDLASIREAAGKLYPNSDPNKVLTVVTKNFVALARSPAEAISGWAMAATRDLYRRMLDVGDFAGALKAADQLAKLAERAEKRRRDDDHNMDIDL